MKSFVLRPLCKGFLALSFLTCHVSASASSPFDGIWYFDPTRSSATDILQLSLAPDGTWTYFDGYEEAKIVLDGKVHRRGSTATGTRSMQLDSHTLVMLRGVHGREDSKITFTLSADGKTIMRKRQRWGWDGKEKQRSKTYVRTSPGVSLEGIWKVVPEATTSPEAGAQSSTPKLGREIVWVIWTDTDGTMTWFIPPSGETLRGKADAKAQPIQGPDYDGEIFTWEKQTSPNRLRFTVYVDGKPVEYAEETLSLDGQTFTDTLWAPGHEDVKQISVYTRQPD